MQEKQIIDDKLRCSKCKVYKPLSEFYNCKKYKTGKSSSCKYCQSITNKKSIIKRWGTINNYYTEYRNKIIGGNPSIIYSKKKFNAIADNIEFKITRNDFVDWYNSKELKCTYCGIKIEDIEKNRHLMPNINIVRLTIDRIDNSKGYEKDNICLSCARCNLIKSNFFTEEEMKEIGEKYVKIKWK